MRRIGEPLHMTIYAELKSMVLSGALNPGDMLPSENELAQQYNTSRVTIRKSLQSLENEGLIYACQGKGYFIAQPLHNDFHFHFSEEERGFEVSYRKVDACFPSEQVRAALELPAGQMVIEVRRVIKKRGRPVALDIKYIPYDKGEPTLEAELRYAVFPDIAAAKTAPFAFHTKMEIGAELPDEEVAAQLQCGLHAPLLVVYRQLIDQTERRVGYGIKYMLSEYGRLDAKSGYELQEKTHMIKIDVIAGFLGAGKTTLINKLLAGAYAGEKPVLIENEFGDVGVDDSLIEDPEIQVRLLASGCICCTLIGGFVDGLIEVAEKYHPSRILVEPTGLAHPRDVLAACETAAKSVPLEVGSLITVVNSENIIPLLTVGGDLFQEQLAEAELIVLSRTQLVDRTQLDAVRQVIRQLNPHAPVLEQEWAQLDALALLSLAEEAHARSSGEVCPVCGHVHGHEHGRVHEHGAENYSSLAFFPGHAFTESQAQALLDALAHAHCGDILRAKGFLSRPDGGFFRAEYVYGQGTLTDITYAGQAKFVVIGRKLCKARLEELMGKD